MWVRERKVMCWQAARARPVQALHHKASIVKMRSSFLSLRCYILSDGKEGSGCV